MTTSHSVLSESNHPDAIERELSWLLKVDPLWRSDTKVDCVPLKKICNGSITEIANNLSNEWAWHGAPKRLGRRFESLLTALFEQTEQCKLLKHGLVVRDQKQTLGELDYLIQLDSQVLHLEVAIKFYAGIGSSSDRSRQQAWIVTSSSTAVCALPGSLGHQNQSSVASSTAIEPNRAWTTGARSTRSANTGSNARAHLWISDSAMECR